MKTEYIGAYSVPDGYFGERAISNVCFDPETGKLIHVFPHGFHSDPFIGKTYIDAEEAKYYLENHGGKRYFK